MAFFEFPHTRTYDSDLAWLIKAYKILTGKVNNIEQTIEDTINEALQGEELKQLITQMIAEALPLNVKYPPADSGLTPATGDGETDDTAALQAMITYANAHNMPMLFPAGVYRVTGLNVNVDTVFQGFDATLMLAPVSASPLINLTANLATSGLTLNGNLGGQTTAQNVVNIVNGSFAITNTTITGGESCIEGTLVGDSIIGDSYLSNFQEYGIHAEGSGRFTASNVVVPSVASGGAMRFMRIDCDNCIVSNFASQATVPIGFELTGNNNAITANTPNVETPVNDGGTGNTWTITGKDENRYFEGNASLDAENYSEKVSGDLTGIYGNATLTYENATLTYENATLTYENIDKTVNHDSNETYKENHTISVSGSMTENILGDKTVNVTGTHTMEAEDVVLNPNNPLTYPKIPVKINDFFSYVEFKNNTDTYHVLVQGDDIENLGEQNLVVNVRDFGAVGDAYYYDINERKFYTSSDKTQEATSDVAAINAAIAYAEENNIHTIYFPDGDYYLPNWSYVLDSSKLSFVGENKSSLCSTGLESGSFISISSPLDLSMYTYARVPLRKIALRGSYFDGGKTHFNVTGLSFLVDEELVSPHISIENVTVMYFENGFYGGTTYKTVSYNLNIIACFYGINMNANATAVPVALVSPHIESCIYAIQMTAPPYNELMIYGGALEYNRIQIANAGYIVMFGTRIEGDILSCKNPVDNTPQVGINCSGSGQIDLWDVRMLFIGNYEANVKFWNPDVSVLDSYTTSYIYSDSTADYGIAMYNCQISTDQYESGFFITGDFLARNLILNGNIRTNASSAINYSGAVKSVDGAFTHPQT